MKAPFKPTFCFKKLTFIFLLFFCFILNSQTKAFPTALGGGAYSRGDVNYTIHEVTNLNPDGPGSFWNALGNNRIVVFKVAGIINMGSVGGSRALNNCIVLGQTAPEGGITVVGRGWRWDNCTNVVFRFVRFRTWQCQDDVWDPCSADSVDVLNSNNIIFDHCSFAYGGDETLSFRGASHTLTVQNCMFSYGKTGMLLGDSNDYNLSYDMSLLNNFFTEISHRFPNPNSNGRVDIIGNLVYSWHNRLMRTGGGVQLNEIGNYYVHPEQELSGSSTWSWNKLDTSQNPPTIYTAMNRATTSLLDSNDDDNSILWQSWQNGRDPLPSDFATNMFPPLNYTDPLPNGDDTLIKVQNREMGVNVYLDNNGNPVVGLDDLDLEGYNGFDNREFYDWSTSLDWEDLPQRQWLIDNLPNYGVVQNQHDESTHTGVVPNVWISSQGLNPSTFNPLGNDLDPTYTNIEIYSFGVDNAEIVNAQGVEVTPETATLNIPETIDLEVIFTPANTTNKSGTWTSSDESIATVDSNGVITPISAGVVTITFTTNDGAFTDTSEITVFPEALQASAGDDQQICEGESTTLTASGGTNYVWSTGETSASIEVTPTETTTYTVTVSDDNEQTDEASVTVTVNSIPLADAGEDQTICEGEIITLTASGGDTYLWSTGETTASIEVSPTAETIYNVEAITNNCSSSDSVTVFMNEAPDLTITEDSAIMEGESITLTASGGDNYEWNTGENTASIIVSPSSTTTYSVSSVGVNGCITNAEVVVTVIPELIANAGNDVTICNGETVTLNASGGSSYAWNTGDTGSELIVSPSITTTYTVTVSDNFGNSETDSVTITVNEAPNVIVSENVTIMEGESTILTASGAPSYLWNTGETSNTITVSPLSTTTYTVTSTLNGCEATAEVTVTVVPELTANAGNDVTICSGETVTLNASGGSSYNWNTGDTGSELIVSPSITTTYTVTVSDNFGNSETDTVTITVNEAPNVSVSDNITIIEGESVTISANGAATYLWNTGQTSSTITVSPQVTSTYTVTGTLNSCSAEAEVTVTVEPLFVASAGSDERVCDNDSYEVILTANEGDSYLWSTGATTRSITVSPLSTTSYTVNVTQGEQEDSDDVTVYVDPSPNVVITNGSNVDILSGDFVTLSATGANTYEWNNGATQPNIAVSPSATTTYQVKGYIGECFEQKQVNVNVYQPVVANAGEDVFMCLNEVAILTATGGDEYLWSTGETTQSIEVSPEETTNYTVTVFNPMHFDEDTVTVEIDASCDINQVNPGEETNDFSFDMFPNPTSKVVNLRFDKLFLATEVNIYDLSGVLTKQNKIDINEADNITKIKLDISSLQAGVYMVKLLYKDNVITKKLIVK